MKKIFKLLIIFLCLFVIVDKVYADDEIGCKYKLTTYDKKSSDEITFYFIKGKGLVDKINIKSSGDTKFPSAIVNTITIFKNEGLYMDYKSTFEGIFDKSITSCPSSLPYMHFGSGSGTYGNGYVLMNFNYHNEPVIEGKIEFLGQIDNSSSSTTPTTPVSNKTNCSNEYVFALNSYLNASNFEEYSIKIQYYMENNKKYAQTSLIKGGSVLGSNALELNPNVHNYIETDYYAKNYGGLKIKIETFDKCDDPNIIKAWKDDAGEYGLFVGVSGKSVSTIDQDSKTELEDEETYQENYATKYGGRKHSIDYLDISDGNMKCTQVLGTILTKIIKSGITIIQIVCAIIAIVKGMMIIIPAVMAKDADALKKGSKTLTSMGIILLIVLLFKPVVRLLGNILGFDISCIL